MLWLGLCTRARVNFGTVSRNSKTLPSTRSDVTKLPEMSTSVYGAGPTFGTHQNLDCFFGFLHERGSACCEHKGKGVPKFQNLA